MEDKSDLPVGENSLQINKRELSDFLSESPFIYHLKVMCLNAITFVQVWLRCLMLHEALRADVLLGLAFL